MRIKMAVGVLVLLGLSVCVSQWSNHHVESNIISGSAHVIDGDSLAVGDKQIRLHGIDAPEMKQACYQENQRYWCGNDAKAHLASMVSGKVVICEIIEYDTYGRAVSTCYLDDLNINEKMVESGHALAYKKYSNTYVGAEQNARISKAGLHSGNYEFPWRWRRKHRN